MAITYRARFLAILRDIEKRLTEMFGDIGVFAVAELFRLADADGNIALAALFDLQASINGRIEAAFLGRARGGLAPFDVWPNGRVIPLSEYSRILFNGIEQAQRLQVEQHANIMLRRLQGSDDIIGTLQRAQKDPFVSPFRPNPLAQYEAPHLWVDQNGYRLSDRVWRTSIQTRRKLDRFLEENIASGRGAREIAKDLEVFLKPGRTLRTKAPYGTDASFDAMRLARTEITRAAAQADEMAANMNPFIDGIEVVLSGSHPKVDICDEAAANGPYPKDAIPPQYQIPMHPHDLCHYRYVMTENSQQVLDSLRDEIRRTRKELMDAIGPLQTDRFTQLLMTAGQKVPA